MGSGTGSVPSVKSSELSDPPGISVGNTHMEYWVQETCSSVAVQRVYIDTTD